MPLAGFGTITQGQARNTFVRFSASIISSAASLGVYGPWTEMQANVGDVDILIRALYLQGLNTIPVVVEVQLGIGASGSEVTIYSNTGHTDRDSNLQTIAFPNVRIPAGSRLAARVKDSEASSNDNWIQYEYLKL